MENIQALERGEMNFAVQFRSFRYINIFLGIRQLSFGTLRRTKKPTLSASTTHVQECIRPRKHRFRQGAKPRPSWAASQPAGHPALSHFATDPCHRPWPAGLSWDPAETICLPNTPHRPVNQRFWDPLRIP